VTTTLLEKIEGALEEFNAEKILRIAIGDGCDNAELGDGASF